MNDSKELNKIFEAILEAAQDKFLGRTFSPVVFIITPVGVLEIPIIDRDSTRVAVQKLLPRTRAVAVITAMEGWMAVIPKEEVRDLDNIVPRTHKSAKEIMIVTLESKLLKRSVVWDVVAGKLENRCELPAIHMGTTAVGGYFDDSGAKA